MCLDPLGEPAARQVLDTEGLTFVAVSRLPASVRLRIMISKTAEVRGIRRALRLMREWHMNVQEHRGHIPSCECTLTVTTHCT